MRADTYIFVYFIGKIGSKYEGKKQADTQPNISKTTYSCAEVVCVGENILGRKWINREVEKA